MIHWFPLTAAHISMMLLSVLLVSDLQKRFSISIFFQLSGKHLNPSYTCVQLIHSSPHTLQLWGGLWAGIAMATFSFAVNVIITCYKQWKWANYVKHAKQCSQSIFSSRLPPLCFSFVTMTTAQILIDQTSYILHVYIKLCVNHCTHKHTGIFELLTLYILGIHK